MILSALWLPAALLAGLFQAWRTALQQRLRSELSVSGAGLVRYLYGAPIAAALLFGYMGLTGRAFPALSLGFIALAATAGLAQIFGTALLIMSFGDRGFVVGTAFSKTEALQAALFSFAILGERLSLLSQIGIAVGVAGILVLALGSKASGGRDIVASLRQRPALYGITAGALFALTGVFVKQAAGLLSAGNIVSSALVTLTIVMLLQTVMHGAYLAWRDAGMLRAVFQTWRSSGQVGILAAFGSACWFIGFAAAPVAIVRIVGQIEVVFTIGFAHFYLRERVRQSEVVGLLLVSLAVVLALAGTVYPTGQQ